MNKKAKKLATIAAEECGFGVCLPSGDFSVNEQMVDGIPVETIFNVNKDVIDGQECFAVYYIPVVDGEGIEPCEWLYTDSLSVDNLAEVINEIMNLFSAEDYRSLLSHSDC